MPCGSQPDTASGKGDSQMPQTQEFFWWWWWIIIIIIIILLFFFVWPNKA